MEKVSGNMLQDVNTVAENGFQKTMFTWRNGKKENPLEQRVADLLCTKTIQDFNLRWNSQGETVENFMGVRWLALG